MMQAHEQTQFLRAVGLYVSEQVRQAVESATQPLLYRVSQLEMMLQENLKGTVAQLEQFDTRIAAIPAGRDGKDAPSEEFVREYIQGAIEATLASWEKPKDGKDGRDGIDGQDGEPGQPGRDGLSVDLDSFHAAVHDAVQAAVAELPVPAAAVSVVGGYIDRDGDLCLTFSDGSIKALGLVVGRDGRDIDPESVYARLREWFDAYPKPRDGKDGADGKDGRDGFGFDDLGMEFDGKHFHLLFKRGDDVAKFLLPTVTYQGIWREGEYKIGDQVTYDGTQWIAMRDTNTQPGTQESGWQLCVKKGRDGRQGDRGPQGKPGKDGRDGRDLTQLAFDGSKY
jgi:hypothetical protein